MGWYCSVQASRCNFKSKFFAWGNVIIRKKCFGMRVYMEQRTFALSINALRACAYVDFEYFRVLSVFS